MPIFHKQGRRVLFAHIPKTAGTSIYLLFLRNGWSVSNLAMADFQGSTFRRLQSEFGLDHIPKEGRNWGYRGSIQHAPARVWRLWPRCDESFAIVRHPVDRYVSALRYQHQSFYPTLSWSAFVAETQTALRASRRKASRIHDGHFRPQVDFVTSSTRIFHFERDWARALCDRYHLDIAHLEQTNRSRKEALDLTTNDLRFITHRFRADFKRFGYDAKQAVT